ncbi:MAG: Fe-S cluster assembly transcription factor [Halomonas sp.]|uniref:Fe-S cluster assembly transcription factor n=1 Tax=Halomonas TaxID=2745 RepID=UPI000BB6FFEA|nr:Fe-S cluster assembly transcription factor [Halomonas sp. JB37]PCC23586.1 Fe-S cluster assembly transcriptional regulator IscR [Halomonas sp. JB37]
MRLTTKGRYAVTAMLDLALHAHNGPTSLSDISQRQEISLSYLEQLFARLRRAGLVDSVRGPGGGYLLSQPPTAISVSNVIDAVNESVDATRCRGLSDCQQGDTCLTHHLWCELSIQIRHFLDEMTLAQLMLRPDVIKIAARQDQRADAGILVSSP